MKWNPYTTYKKLLEIFKAVTVDFCFQNYLIYRGILRTVKLSTEL